MRKNQLKILVTAIILLPSLLLMVINAKTSAVNAVSIDDEATVTLYKTKCIACHGATAAKFYDPEMPIDEQVQIILKGKKGAKPPFMPEYETKGIDTEKATALAQHMKNLRTSAGD